MQGNNDTLINSGTIQTTGTASSSGSVDAVVSNTLGSSFTATITNAAGGKIISNNGIGVRSINGNTTITNAGLIQGGGGTAIKNGNGNATLILQTGSQIVGTAVGGGGTNIVRLQGSGTASNAFVNYQSLTMEGDDWTWAGTGTFSTALVKTGRQPGPALCDEEYEARVSARETEKVGKNLQHSEVHGVSRASLNTR
ncbi:hypothetical protein [Paraburkholderia pallida]|uniref:hypothetical protein n=1 Tax=Paraburkholderia pallida TaxID=2547399 RepID=UPI001E2BC6F7|nr:hypothetical protein [Paraburkholderia pallida]